MSRLKVFKEGQFLFEVLLSAQKEWIAGRGQGCAIPLEAEHGISRQHFKIYNDGQSWYLQVLSRYGELYVDGEKISEAPLTGGMHFTVPPYEFQFEDNTSSNVVSFRQDQDATHSISESSDRTMIGIMTAHPFLKVINNDGIMVQVFQLEGDSWIAGRDTSCAIFIDYAKFSRRHFEIRHQDGAYAIKDLGSSNGTLLNGSPVSTQEWMHLKSRDVILSPIGICILKCVTPTSKIVCRRSRTNFEARCFFIPSSKSLHRRLWRHGREYRLRE
jgi:pSer/pThr/pTyr-binding forkhead associated (FHA) protein